MATVHIGKKSLQSIQNELEDLRRACGQSLDILTSTPVFLTTTVRSNTLPIVVLIRSGTAPFAAVLLHAHRIMGIPTGVITAGYACGRGAIIAQEADQILAAETAASALRRGLFFHAVVIRLLQCDAAADTMAESRPRQVTGRWIVRDERSCISLEGGMNGLMARLSHKMRRNLRYYRRRAEKDLSCVFIPQLSPSQSRQAVEALNGTSAYPISTVRALRYEAAQRDTPGSFAMGLRDGAGNWLSFLSGWRGDTNVYVTWQLNLADHNAASLSTVMRSYFLEHEIGRGALRIIFVGGTTPVWQRACAPQVCRELFVVRNGIVGTVARAVAHGFSPTGNTAALYAAASIGGSFPAIARPALEQPVADH